MVCVVKEENKASLHEGRSGKMSSLVSDGCWFPVVPSLLQPSIGSEVSELFPSCDFNWWATPEPMESKQGKADSEEIDSLVVCVGLHLVSGVGFFLRGAIVSVIKDGVHEAVGVKERGFCWHCWSVSSLRRMQTMHFLLPVKGGGIGLCAVMVFLGVAGLWLLTWMNCDAG